MCLCSTFPVQKAMQAFVAFWHRLITDHSTCFRQSLLDLCRCLSCTYGPPLSLALLEVACCAPQVQYRVLSCTR